MMLAWGCCVAMLQEVYTPMTPHTDRMLIGRHVLLTSSQGEGRKAAGLLLDVSAEIGQVRRAAGIVVAAIKLEHLGEVAVASVHAPADRDILALESFIQMLENMLRNMPEPHIIAGDFQADTDPTSDSDTRGMVWSAWFRGRRMHHITLQGTEPTWVRHSGRQAGRKDSIWMHPSLIIPGTVSTLHWIHDVPSDHALIRAPIARTQRPVRPHRIPRWKDTTDTAREWFTAQLSHLDSTSIEAWELGAVELAKNLRAHPTRESEPEVVHRARAAISEATTRADWSRARRELWRLLRRTRRERATEHARHIAQSGRAHTWHRTNIQYIEVEGIDGQRIHITDPSVWPAFLQSHQHAKFGNGTGNEAQRAWVALAALQVRAQSDTMQPIEISPELVGRVLQKCQPNRAPGPNGLAYEHIASAGPGVLEVLAGLFTQRANDTRAPPVTTWQEVVLTYIPKSRSRALHDMRAIAIIDCLLKVYMRCILFALQQQSPVTFPSWQYGFVPGRQCADMLFLLQAILLRAGEWGIPVVLVKLDVSHAFDNISYDELWGALLHLGIPINFAFAILREVFGCRATSRVGAIQTQGPELLERGGRQGAPETPLLWNAFLSRLLEPLVHQWHESEAGVDMEKWMSDRGMPTPEPSAALPPRVSLAVWADDLVLLAHDTPSAQKQIDSLTGALAKSGIKVKAAKAEMLLGKWATGTTVVVDGEVVLAKPSLVCLGVELRPDGSAIGHVERQLAHATAAFRSRTAAFRSRCISLRAKMGIWMRTIAPALLWGMEVLPVGFTAARRLDGIQMRHFAFMLGHRSHEDLATSWQNRYRRVRVAMERWGISQVSVLMRQRLHSWAGHAVRSNGAGTLLMQWRDERWWQHHCGTTSEHRRMRRPTPGHQIRWEASLVQYLGREWPSIASERDSWRASAFRWMSASARTRRSGFSDAFALIP
jgi:hypothetical protein